MQKYDKDTEEKLSGAIFTLYRDTDSDGEYNATVDNSYGILSETDGVYTISSVEYGDYLLKETNAPTGYVVDTEVYSCQ